MGSFLVACLAAVVIALGAALVLNNAVQKSADRAFHSITSVRLPPVDHGP